VHTVADADVAPAGRLQGLLKLRKRGLEPPVVPGPLGLPGGLGCNRDSTTGEGCGGGRTAAMPRLHGGLRRCAGQRGLRFRCGLGADRPHADRHIQASQLARLQHAHTDHLTRQLLAALIADIEHHEILAGLGGDLVGNAAIDTERAITLVGGTRKAASALKRRWCRHPGQIAAVSSTVALQCGQTRVAPGVPERMLLIPSAESP
jgi:hypothetical protein